MYFLAATRMALIEHLRNRLALWLVVLYVPMWLLLVDLVISDAPVRFVLRATGATLWARGNQLSQMSGALNTVTQIAGFMMFSVTFASGAFDRRLALAGYPRVHLVTAKSCALVVVSTVVSGYAALIMTLFWHPRQPWLLAVSLFTAALTYGALGVLLGALLRGELEGMFLIIMTSIVDAGLQNPISNNAAGSDVERVLPTHGATQAARAAGYSSATSLDYLALQLAWFAVLTGVGLVVFHRRTRDRSARPPRALALTTRAGGTRRGRPGAGPGNQGF
ncbi:ABC transporter permease [Streptomyces sp. NPDC048506]|uniref:ABC transporter permease n=1 Tax=Streptomyces sp. NPDC048506 TaxID=3155028 RepID=UPI00341E421D